MEFGSESFIPVSEVGFAAPSKLICFPDNIIQIDDEIRSFDNLVREYISRKQIKGTNAFYQGETLDFGDHRVQSVQFAIVDPDKVAELIEVYGKRVDCAQVDYALARWNYHLALAKS
jgi:hypothetical protein